MRVAELREWLNANIEAKQRQFGIPHFRLVFCWEPGESEGAMQCVSLPEYERATITIWYANYAEDDNINQFENDIEHELMHVVHSPFEMLRATTYELLKDDEQTWLFWAEWYRKCCEMTVRNLERMAYGLRESNLP